MAAGKYSFIIEQGATTNFQINWNDETGSAVDLSGYQARMQIRPGVEASDVFISLSSSLQPDGTGIHLSGSNGYNSCPKWFNRSIYFRTFIIPIKFWGSLLRFRISKWKRSYEIIRR